MSKITWLHLSDWHQQGDDFNRKVVRDALLNDIKNRSLIAPELAKPDFIIFSGDVAQHGKKEAYDYAVDQLLAPVLATTGLSPDRLFIVPGNHDLDRDQFEMLPKALTDPLSTNDDVIKWLDEKRRSRILEPFSAFSFFVREYTGQKSPAYADIKEISLDCGTKVTIAGLNSALMCGRNPDGTAIVDKGSLIIGEPQVKNVVDRLGKEGIRIAVMHHPFEFLTEDDHDLVADDLRGHFQFILHGHTHKSGVDQSKSCAGKCVIIAAGACYGERKTANRRYVNAYNFVNVDLNSGKGEVYLREWNDAGKDWIPQTGKEHPRGIFTVTVPGWRLQPEGCGSEVSGDTGTPIPEDKFQKYFSAVYNENRELSLKGFVSNFNAAIPMTDVYVSLRARVHAAAFEYTLDGMRKLREFEEREELSDLDLKSAMDAAKERSINTLVILGKLGSGKTTLLKYILIMLYEKKAVANVGITDSLIPLFAPMRNLQDPQHEDFIDFIMRECRLTEFSITPNELRALLKEKRVIVLLDGIDEVADADKRTAACHWIDRARRTFTDTPFIVTSRLAGYFGESRLEGNLLELRIQEFNDAEIRNFLNYWCTAVALFLHPKDDKEVWKSRAEAEAALLYADIRKNEAVRNLATNPLMLQILACIYKGRGTALPKRRVELYHECVTVFLERWDLAKHLAVPFRSGEARKLLQTIALWLHGKEGRKCAPLDEIVEVIRKPLDSLDRGDVDPRKLLLNIRDRSGIFMGHNETEFGFMHLSFQEFLAAEEVRNRVAEDPEAIEILIENYGNHWWREVTLLALALDSPSILNRFTDRIVRTPKFTGDSSIALEAIQQALSKPWGVLKAALDAPDVESLTKAEIRRILQVEGRMIEEPAPYLIERAFEIMRVLNPTKSRATIVNVKDGSELLLIPMGTFLYGSRDDDPEAMTIEMPQRSLYLPDFYISKYPVTNVQYKKFIDATGHRTPEETDDPEWGGRPVWEGALFTPDKADHPVVCVSWEDAIAYARWAELGLPTEAEWEKAARGVDGRVYPWGIEWSRGKCNSREAGAQGTTLVGRYENDQSPYGCYDMAGNVCEWCEDLFNENSHRSRENRTYGRYMAGTHRVIRGGSWVYDQRYCRCAYRDSNDCKLRNGYTGFRVVKKI